MVATLSKIGEGAFADVYGCQGDDWRKLALKVKLFNLENKCFYLVHCSRFFQWVETLSIMTRIKIHSNPSSLRLLLPCE